MKRFHPLTILCLVAALTGFAFSAVSTADFVAHLDRQVHGIHCSFLPGLTAADQSGESGCHTTLMSPYSSVLRSMIWGGIPIAIPSMAVFTFLAFACLWLVINGRERDIRATGFLLAATLVPVGASAVMGYLSIVELDATCKLCIGIYSSSAVCFLSALLLWRTAPPSIIVEEHSRDTMSAEVTTKRSEIQPVSWAALALAFGVGLAFVIVPVAGYAAQAPDFSTYVGSCGELPEPGYDRTALIEYGPQGKNVDMLMVLDPLCPSCKGFEERLEKMDIAEQLNRQLLLFPLDESCNWMIDRSIHPGACSVSEAVLCAQDPRPVLEWAFSKQHEIMQATTQDPQAAEAMVKSQFPGLASCVGSTEAKARLNLSLRWAVQNRLQILTPQVFVQGARLCGEDTDLGLDYALPRLVDRMKNRPRPEPALNPQEAPTAAPDPAPSKRATSKRSPERNSADAIPSKAEEPSPPAENEDEDAEDADESDSLRPAGRAPASDETAAKRTKDEATTAAPTAPAAETDSPPPPAVDVVAPKTPASSAPKEETP